MVKSGGFVAVRRCFLTAVVVLGLLVVAPRGAEAHGYGLSGDDYVFITGVDRGERRVTVNVIEWFTGAAAVRACRVDQQPASEVEWCNDYYYRDRSGQLRTVEVDADASISVIDAGGSSVPGRFADLSSTTDRPYRVTVVRGRITAVHQIYIP